MDLQCAEGSAEPLWEGAVRTTGRQADERAEALKNPCTISKLENAQTKHYISVLFPLLWQITYTWTCRLLWDWREGLVFHHKKLSVQWGNSLFRSLKLLGVGEMKKCFMVARLHTTFSSICSYALCLHLSAPGAWVAGVTDVGVNSGGKWHQGYRGFSSERGNCIKQKWETVAGSLSLSLIFS